MTLMRAGGGLFLTGMALIVVGSQAEVQAIRLALTRRLKIGIALSLSGIAVMLLGARLQGEIVAHRLKRRFRPQIDEMKRKLGPVLSHFKTAAGS